MIRRDYILRMVQEYVAALSRIRALKQGQKWNEATGELDAEFEKLMGEGGAAIARLSETELLARLMKEGPTHAVKDKTFILVSMLAESGELAAEQGRGEEARACRLRALHVLLEMLAREDVFEWPEFVPKVGALVGALDEVSLPVRTLAMLMQHYERVGELGKAEDMLYAILDAEPENKGFVGFGVNFYERLLTQPDVKLEEGGLPRAEVEEGLREIAARAKSP